MGSQPSREIPAKGGILTEPYPWLKLSHRLKEIPTILLALFAGGEERGRLVEIIRHREEQRAELERRHVERSE